jgi:ABC-type phosphate/phosphonate transport system ATPase subunit
MWELTNVRLGHTKVAPPVLTDVSVQIAHSEKLVVLGASGAGKSTLLRCFAGDLAPIDGTFCCDSADVYRSETARQSYQLAVAMIRQTGDLVPRLTARSNILLAVANRWTAGDFVRVMAGRPTVFDPQVSMLAEQHGVSHLLKTPVERLSGGERQRVALLQALLREPQLILADEPTNGLDPATATAALDALMSVTGVTLVVATHDLRIATTFPRMIALNQGQVVHDGAPLDADALRELYTAERWELT